MLENKQTNSISELNRLRYLFMRVQALARALDNALIGSSPDDEAYEDALILSDILTDEVEKFKAISNEGDNLVSE